VNGKMVALVLIGAMVMTMAAVLAYDLYDSDTENGTYGIAHAWVGADLDESGYIEHHYHGGHGGWVTTLVDTLNNVQNRIWDLSMVRAHSGQQ